LICFLYIVAKELVTSVALWAQASCSLVSYPGTRKMQRRARYSFERSRYVTRCACPQIYLIIATGQNERMHVRQIKSVWVWLDVWK